MSKIAIVSVLEMVLAKVAETDATIKYSAPQPHDIVVGQVSEFTLKLAAYTNQLRRDMALVETELQYETDVDSREQLVLNARRLHGELTFVQAAYELQIRGDLGDSWDARITLRAGGVAVVTKADKLSSQKALAELNARLDRKIEGGAGGQSREASIFDALGIDVDDLPDLANLFGGFREVQPQRRRVDA